MLKIGVARKLQKIICPLWTVSCQKYLPEAIPALIYTMLLMVMVNSGQEH